MTQRVLQTGPFAEAMRSGDFDAVVDGDCQNVVNPLLDGTKYLPNSVSHRELRQVRGPEVDRDLRPMLRETDFAKQRALMREFEKHMLDTEAHEIFSLWRYRIVPHQAT